MFGVGLFKFDGNLEVGLDVDSLIYLSEGPLINFADDLVVFTHLLRHLWHASNK